MERKQLKKYLSKGVRLGWTPLEKVQKIYVTSLTIKGRRVTVRRVQPEQPVQTNYLVP